MINFKTYFLPFLNSVDFLKYNFKNFATALFFEYLFGSSILVFITVLGIFISKPLLEINALIQNNINDFAIAFKEGGNIISYVKVNASAAYNELLLILLISTIALFLILVIYHTFIYYFLNKRKGSIKKAFKDNIISHLEGYFIIIGFFLLTTFYSFSNISEQTLMLIPQIQKIGLIILGFLFLANISGNYLLIMKTPLSLVLLALISYFIGVNIIIISIVLGIILSVSIFIYLKSKNIKKLLKDNIMLLVFLVTIILEILFLHSLSIVFKNLSKILYSLITAIVIIPFITFSRVLFIKYIN